MKSSIYRLRDEQEKRFIEQKNQGGISFKNKDFRNTFVFYIAAIEAYSRFLRHAEACTRCDRFDTEKPMDFKWSSASRMQLLWNLKNLFSDLFYAHNDSMPDMFSRSQQDYLMESYLYRLLLRIVQLEEYRQNFTEEQMLSMQWIECIS